MSIKAIDDLIRVSGAHFSYCEPELKEKLHNIAEEFLKVLAASEGLTSVSIRRNPGGIAVSGEVTLLSDLCYVQVSQAAFQQTRGGLQVLIRGVRHLEDYEGLHNLWVNLTAGLDPERALQEITDKVAAAESASKKFQESRKSCQNSNHHRSTK